MPLNEEESAKSPEDVFNRVFAARGGRLHPAPPHLARTLELHRKRMQDWIAFASSVSGPSSLPEIYFDFIANGSINAVATERDHRAYIGFNWGTIVILGDLFCRMLSHPQVLRSIGNPAGESLDPIFQDGLTLDGTSLQNRRWGTAGPQENQVWAITPKDPLRLHAAEICRLMALDFLFFHELAHVGYGHIEYQRRAYNQPIFVEFDSSDHPPDWHVTRQSLEMNADAFAASASLNAFLINRGELRKSIPEVAPLLDDKVAVFLWAFAIASLFCTFTPTFDVTSLTSSNYLPASIRLEGNVKCGLDSAAIAHSGIKNLVDTASLDLRHVGHAFASIGHKIPEEQASRYAASRSDKRIEEHVQRVISRFRELKLELKAYSRFDLDQGTPSDEPTSE